MLTDVVKSPRERRRNEETSNFQVAVSFYYTWHLTLRYNRPLRTAIYISLCSTASRKHPLFSPWEKWRPKIHFMFPNLRTMGSFLSRGPFLRSSLRFLTVFGRLTLISCLSVPRPFPERIVERLEESAFRSIARETNETRGNRLCCSTAPSLSSTVPRSYPFYTANSFSTRMKGKLQDDQELRNEKISLQIYVFWAYFLSMK